jgi:eukaryotic-like serine/threonine-protein kinase
VQVWQFRSAHDSTSTKSLVRSGLGAWGEVCRARDVVLKREVAIKILPPAHSSDTRRLQRFQQEAQAVAALNHPNVLALYQVGEHDGCPYLVTELLEGDTLRESSAAARYRCAAR